MTRKKQIKSNIIGLDMGLAVGRFFLNTEDLHYGYWPNNEKPTVQNFAWAQENHSKLIMDNIPVGTKNILDVGSGSGNLALKLSSAGYDVDCVIPSKYLANAVNEKLNANSNIYISKFEDFFSKKKYDLILFSESFQYVNIDKSLKLVKKILRSKGHLLICDFFKQDISEKSPMGGGHRWVEFQQSINNFNLNNLIDLNITNETAPTIDFLNNFCQEVLKPMANMTGQYLYGNYPIITKIFMWKYQKKLKKIKNRYLSGSVNGISFKKFKTYRLLLYTK